MGSNTNRVRELYEATLRLCPDSTEKYYECLRRRGIFPTPAEQGDLYAPNPVIVAGTIVEKMVDDLNRFVALRRSQTPDARSLLDQMPPDTQTDFASPEIAEELWQLLQREMPLAQLDAFLVNPQEAAYLEWQTFGSYPTLARWVLQCARTAWPPLADASMTATRNWGSKELDEKLHALYTRGIEDDPRSGVVLDYRPMEQVTRREFLAIQELTGGPDRGLGIIDPREIFYQDHRPCYRRAGNIVPIRLVYSRLVHGEMCRLIRESAAAERALYRRFFGNPGIRWLSHPLHFYFGTKEHFADFHTAKLSESLPETFRVTDALLAESQRERKTWSGHVFKPSMGHGGLDVTLDPVPEDLKSGGLLQKRIYPAACHPTFSGNRVPEIRLMAIPDNGRLAGAALFTRVMHPDDFKSNAGAIAARNRPGTGEGYGFVVW